MEVLMSAPPLLLSQCWLWLHVLPICSWRFGLALRHAWLTLSVFNGIYWIQPGRTTDWISRTVFWKHLPQRPRMTILAMRWLLTRFLFNMPQAYNQYFRMSTSRSKLARSGYFLVGWAQERLRWLKSFWERLHLHRDQWQFQLGALRGVLRFHGYRAWASRKSFVVTLISTLHGTKLWCMRVLLNKTWTGFLIVMRRLLVAEEWNFLEDSDNEW